MKSTTYTLNIDNAHQNKNIQFKIRKKRGDNPKYKDIKKHRKLDKLQAGWVVIIGAKLKDPKKFIKLSIGNNVFGVSANGNRYAEFAIQITSTNMKFIGNENVTVGEDDMPFLEDDFFDTKKRK